MNKEKIIEKIHKKQTEYMALAKVRRFILDELDRLKKEMDELEALYREDVITSNSERYTCAECGCKVEVKV